MRKALVVGIDFYFSFNCLYGCVNDAHSVKSVLDRHADGTINFDVRLLSGTGQNDPVLCSDLKNAARELFSDDVDTALFYFAGHGFVEAEGGYLVTSECTSGDNGLSLNDLLAFANGSPAKNKVIILDSCHSGVAGTLSSLNTYATVLIEGITILTASTADQYAKEENGSGVFTALLVDALSGGAANIVGEITPGSIYAHIDQSLGSWGQRPVFKTNVKSFVSLRRVQPPIDIFDLRKISEFFPIPGFEFPLDPSYEPQLKGRDEGMPPPDKDKVEMFAILQKFYRLNLLVPVDAQHMWNAAMESKACRLTVLGEHYRRLASNSRI